MNPKQRPGRSTGGALLSPGQRIQALRAARGWTQDELSQHAKLSKSFLSELENDRAIPGGEVLLRLAEVLGTTTDYLLRGADVAGETPAREPVTIPPELWALAEELNLTFPITRALLDARRLVVARRGKPDTRVWQREDWKQLYDKLRVYLE